MRRVCGYVVVVFVWIAAFAPPAFAADEIVLYAADAASLHGNWSRVSDSSAAGGQRLSSADNGGSWTAGPLASPANYVDFTFSAPANTPYRVWLRLRAGSDSKFNDSVFVQFSNAQTTGGSSIDAIGTTNGFTVN